MVSKFPLRACMNCALRPRQHSDYDMAKTEKTQPSRLMPSPKALQKALEQSAKQAQRMADAFGVVVPGIKPKQANSSRNAG